MNYNRDPYTECPVQLERVNSPGTRFSFRAFDVNSRSTSGYTSVAKLLDTASPRFTVYGIMTFPSGLSFRRAFPKP